MQYTYPQYFYDFRCDASDCSDTCCTGWKIKIDPISLKKYRNYPGFFGNRLKNSIDWKTGTFEQYHGRCTFLSDENLCDIYTEAGKKMLCKTCTRYPRHYEEYENLREISLSLSCPAAAKLMLESEEKVSFENSFRETPEEEYQNFDFFLFDKLLKIRKYFYEVIQNREWSIEFRLALLLGTAHDLQNRITKKRFPEIEISLSRYRKPSFIKMAEKKFGSYHNRVLERRIQLHRMWRRLYRLEEIRPGWIEFLKQQEKSLYQNMALEEYGKVCQQFAKYYKSREYEYEQLLMYFVFTYLCGAVYDGDAFGKMKFCVVSLMLIREMDMAMWLSEGRTLSLENQVWIVHHLSRELEHSDENMNTMELMLEDEELFELSRLLKGILG